LVTEAVAHNSEGLPSVTETSVVERVLPSPQTGDGSGIGKFLKTKSSSQLAIRRVDGNAHLDG
jgi:hypothetical protein